MNIKTTLRHGLRYLGQRFPQLRRYSGRLGLGRLLARGQPREQIRIDGDVIIELDLSVPQFRHYYYNFDLSSAAESILIRQLLSPDSTFVDVGAHLGYFALIAAKYARHVFAFEPGPDTYARLERNLELNPALATKITAYAVGLSEHCGTADFYFAADDPGGSSLRPVEWARTSIKTIQLETLDHLLTGQSLSFIKVDVEGAELDVLRGGSGILRRDQPLVLCELFEKWQQRFGRTIQDTVSFLHELEYEGYRVEEKPAKRGRIKVTPLNVAELDTVDVNNALFVPSARASDVLDRLEECR